MTTFVLVHGGGHGAWCWDRLAPLLRAEGHDVHTPVLQGVGERFDEVAPDVGLAVHVGEVADSIVANDLSGVVLVGHSYGCMVITGVAGEVPDRIAELVFLDGPHPQDGESLDDVSPGMRERLEPQLREVDGVPLCLFPNRETLGVYGIVDPADEDWAMQHLTPHPWKCFIERLALSDPDAPNRIPRTSINCLASGTQDDAKLVARTRLADRCFEIDTGHDLMISEPRATADLLLEVARNPVSKTPKR
ncbi:MAG: alpha/beta fold hydrolase [Novosphingobium sp.]|nr:alpha/beta fold hydrolase [Novosphingobium sp.]